MNDKAKYIPYHTRHKLYKYTTIIIITLLLGVYPSKNANGTGERLFYARLDIKYSDNRVKKSNFIMIPSDNEFRSVNFTYRLISGTADYAHNDPNIPIEKRAEHNAIQCLLEQYGLKSIKSKSTYFNNSGHNETVVSYEGLVKLPCKIIKKKFNKKNNACTITIKIAFSPIAFPDQWSMLKLKYKIQQFINNIISLFK